MKSSIFQTLQSQTFHVLFVSRLARLIDEEVHQIHPPVITRQVLNCQTLLSSKAVDTISEVLQSTYRGGKHSEYFSTVNLLHATMNTQTSYHSAQAFSFHQAALKRPIIKSKTAPFITGKHWCISFFTSAFPHLLSVVNVAARCRTRNAWKSR